jgi:trimethylamine:corrinoid methyltransferase-like protein
MLRAIVNRSTRRFTMFSRNPSAGCALALVGTLALASTASAAPSLQFVAGRGRGRDRDG